MVWVAVWEEGGGSASAQEVLGVALSIRPGCRGRRLELAASPS